MRSHLWDILKNVGHYLGPASGSNMGDFLVLEKRAQYGKFLGTYGAGRSEILTRWDPEKV